MGPNLCPLFQPHPTPHHTIPTPLARADNDGAPINITEFFYLPSVSRALPDTAGRAWPGNAGEAAGLLDTRCWCVGRGYERWDGKAGHRRERLPLGSSCMGARG